MLTEICAEINNYFTRDEDKHMGDFKITDGQITPSVDILDGQYYRVIGSVFNDGVHKYGDSNDTLTDEPSFYGSIWVMRVPKAVIDVSAEIEEWESKNSGVLNSPYTSESFAGYSYTLGSNSSGNTGTSWKDQENFASKLNRYRKVNVL